MANRAAALKAVYFELDYDAARFTPLGAQASGVLSRQEPDAPRLIELAVLSRPGVVHHGQLIPRAQARRGFSGSGELASVTFSRRAMPRAASAAPRTDLSKTTLSWSALGVLRWSFSSAGDYNQNGEVGISDLTPLGANYQESVAPAKFDYSSVESVVDGDNNGAINISDITPIGANFGVGVRRYQVFASPSSGDYPATNQSASLVPALGEVGVEDSPDSPSGARLTYSYTVASPGEGYYYWVRPADDSGPGTPSNALQYFTPNQSPTADLAADVTSGPSPLQVNFDASASTDADGSISKFEFDWDGAGSQFSYLDNGAVPTASHTYDSAGSFPATVRVTDNKGATGVAQLIISVAAGAPPVAAIGASPTSGSIGMEVTFDASASTDDGAIVKYEWDFDGDGAFEFDSGASPSALHTYDNAGQFEAQVRVTDDESLTGTASVTISVSDGSGAPVADITATPGAGSAPLNVTLDASGSTGSIVLYEWDFEGDGTYDFSGPAPAYMHTYLADGIYQPTVRVTDDQDRTDTASGFVTVFPGLPEVLDAVLYADPRYGAAPLTVIFDATKSTSPDKPFTKFEWDWDGDGNWDDDSGADGIAKHDYTEAGVYDATVRVTDSASNQDTRTMLVLALKDINEIPDDSVFALPSQSKAKGGETVGVELYCKATANPMTYPVFRITLEKGSDYVANSWNPGVFGGAQQEPDGVWAGSGATGFIAPPFFGFEDAGGGRVFFDTIVAPYDVSDIIGATGAMMNFELVINVDTSFGFIRSDGGFNRTMYQDSNMQEFNWTYDDNAGMPGIDVL